MFLICFSYVLMIRIYVKTFYFGNHDSLRFMMTFPVLRLFSAVHGTRTLVFTMLKLGPRIIYLLFCIYVVFYVYAVYGVYLFAGQNKMLQGLATQASFDDLSQAHIALFQIFVKQNWNDLMYAAIRATRGFGSSWFYISFVVIVTLLFVNILLGIVLDAYTEVYELQRDARNYVKRRKYELLLHKRHLSNSGGSVRNPDGYLT